MNAIQVNGMSGTERKRLHPHKFTLWIGIGSIVMMFAGLTSAVIVKRNLGNWQSFVIPRVFWFSTAVILATSLTMQMALRAFKERSMKFYRMLMTATAIGGIIFIVLQFKGFEDLWAQNLHFSNSIGVSFLYIIFGLHALHVLGGIIALLVLFGKAFSARKRNYSPVPVEIVSVYWHFVDLLWLYLLVFFVLIQ
jgi:cytochrome c oxidase subunit 3